MIQKKNRERAICFIEEACRRGSNFVVLPELWTTGYSLENIRELAEPLDGTTITKLLDICSKWKTYVIGSIAELREGKIFNTAAILGPEGVCMHAWARAHLCMMRKVK